MLDAALMYFAQEKYYKAEKARRLFKRWVFLTLTDEQHLPSVVMREAEKAFDEARPDLVKVRPQVLGLQHVRRHCHDHVQMSRSGDAR